MDRKFQLGQLRHLYGQLTNHVHDSRQAQLIAKNLLGPVIEAMEADPYSHCMALKTLIMTVGLPRSGKSTWARLQGVPIVSRDSIRWALHGRHFFPMAEPMVFAIAETMVNALFTAGHSIVVLDVTNTTKAQRQQWCNTGWESRYKVFNVPVAVCVERAKESERFDLIPVIERMAANFDPLDEHELKHVWQAT